MIEYIGKLINEITKKKGINENNDSDVLNENNAKNEIVKTKRVIPIFFRNGEIIIEDIGISIKITTKKKKMAVTK